MNAVSRPQEHAGASKAAIGVHPDIGSSAQAPEPKSAWRITIEDASGIPFVIDCFSPERTKAAQEAIRGYQLWRPEGGEFGADFIIVDHRELLR